MPARQWARNFCAQAEAEKPAAEEESGSPDVTIAPFDDVEPKIAALADEICHLNMLQLADLSKLLKDRLGIDDSMLYGGMGGGGGMVMAAPAAGAAPAAAEEEAPAEEKTEFDLKLTGFDAKQKIKVIKAVREMTSLGLKEAKEVVEGAPSVIKEAIKKEEAEELAEKLKEVGAEIEIA